MIFNCFKKKKKEYLDREGDTAVEDEISSVKTVLGGKPNIKIALCTGHSEKRKGALIYNNTREFDWCEAVAKKVLGGAEDGMIYLFNRSDNMGYTSAMEDLAKRVHKEGCTHAIELHLNAAGIPEARGCEALIKMEEDESAHFAKPFITKFSEEFDIKLRGLYKGVRGIKALKPGDRGYGFVNEMDEYLISSFIWEPFFCDYATEDSKQFIGTDGVDKMANFLVDRINEFN